MSPRVALCCIALAVAVMACGPSLRRTYESDNAFARCFDADYKPGVGVEEKRACWSEWLEGRLYNQPEDKIGYARLRLVDLDHGVSVPGPPGPPGAFDQRPVPAKPVAAPRQIRPAVKDGSDAGTGDAGVGEAPGAKCQSRCGESWKACKGACGATGPQCISACEAGYRTCMVGCFSQ
ncbi:MAG: hypothetical protein PHU25_15620 [Deltaproteobacteria bacterium]|nr:hypothetical protein [Deltaproteobacteria bacterium]